MSATSDASPLPLSFRRAEVQVVAHYMCAHESCAVIGLASSGKSNFARFLCRPDVIRAYLGDDAEAIVPVLIDGHSLTRVGSGAWQVYELILHRLLQRLDDLELPPEKRDQLEQSYERVVVSQNELLGQRYLERFAHVLCGQLGRRLVLVFDEFDEVMRDVDRRFLLNLRATRDEHKERLSFVLCCRTELARMVSDVAEIEGFHELIAHNTIGLKPYIEPDAHIMIERMARRTGTKLSEEEIAVLLRVSGGHPGLLRATFHAWFSAATGDRPIDPDSLRSHPRVWDECFRIWEGLDEDEQACLAAVSAGSAASQLPTEALSLLTLKGAVRALTTSENEVFAPAMAYFLAANQPELGRGVTIDRSRAAVVVDGRIVSDLTRLEFALLAYLTEHSGRICTRDELLLHLYPDEAANDAELGTDNRLDSTIARLRGKIEPDRKHPRFVQTVRGRGFRMLESAPPPLPQA